MSIKSTPDEQPVEKVSSTDEGRLAYIADMAGQLARMASDAGEHGLAGALADAARTATAKMQKMMRG